jgi:hypothetical protein
MYVNKKPLLFSIMLLLRMVCTSENVASDGAISVDMMPLHATVKFTVTRLVPHTDYAYTAEFIDQRGYMK